jgi:hypothetical protein
MTPRGRPARGRLSKTNSLANVSAGVGANVDITV